MSQLTTIFPMTSLSSVRSLTNERPNNYQNDAPGTTPSTLRKAPNPRPVRSTHSPKSNRPNSTNSSRSTSPRAISDPLNPPWPHHSSLSKRKTAPSVPCRITDTSTASPSKTNIRYHSFRSYSINSTGIASSLKWMSDGVTITSASKKTMNERQHSRPTRGCSSLQSCSSHSLIPLLLFKQ